ncbi:MAG: hypothetical protein IJ848_02475 [Alphaproteobacteria bacterium]|nr:hypothetical protein [Alphaproteobacteria bacterium]
MKKKINIKNKQLIIDYYRKLCYNDNYFNKRLFICFILLSLVSASATFSIMKVGFAYRDERIVEMQNQLESYKGKVHSINTVLDTVTSDLDNIKTDVKTNKESSSDSLVRLAGLIKDVQHIKEVLNIIDDTKQNNPEEDLNSLPADKREFIEAFENLIKDGVPFSNFIEEKIDITKYKTADNLLAFKDNNVKSIDSLKKDFTAIGASVFGNQTKESFWQKQLRIFKERISNAIRLESTSDNKIKDLGNNLDDKVLFEKAQSYINSDNINEALEVLNKMKSTNEHIITLKSDLKSRVELNTAFSAFKSEFFEVEMNNTSEK